MTGEYKIIRDDQTKTFTKDEKDRFEETVEFLRREGEEFDTVTPDDETAADGGAKPTVVDEPDDEHKAEPVPDNPSTNADTGEEVPDSIPVDKDPLEVLPSYMIDHVQGQPALNKRGLSVLAYNYGVTVVDREIIVSPHESDWEYAIVETTVENEDGNRFVGTGTAHVDRGDDKEILLEMAETRSYKRSVSFGTGTGIVSYQELTNQLE